jgi:hypothetical protein
VAWEDVAHIPAFALGAQLLIALGQHLRHCQVHGSKVAPPPPSSRPVVDSVSSAGASLGRPAWDGPRAAARGKGHR